MFGTTADLLTKTIDDVVQEHIGDAPLADDVTLVVVSRSLTAHVPQVEVEDATLQLT